MREMKDSGVEWIGEVPANWDMLRIYQLAFPVKKINEGMKEDNLLSLSYGNIVQKDINKVDGLVPASYEGYNIIEPGDIVLRFTDLQNDQRSLRTGLCNFDGIITSAYLTIRPRHELVSSKYLHYVLHFVDTLKVFYNMGGGMRQSLDWNGVSHMFLPIPSKPEQRRIVSYLDERCAAIDEDVAKRREVIEKLREYKKALIAHVVTKGLDPDAEMKDSGVEWIGEVPAGWTVAKLSYFASSVLGKMIDRKQETSNNVHRYLSNRDVGWFSINVDNLSETSFPENSDARYGIEDGDVLICEGGEVGKCCVWRGPSPDFYFQKAIHRLRVNKKTAVPEYIAYQMLQKSIEGNFIEVRRGEATISHLPGDQLMMLKFILPPLDEQRRIVSYLDEHRAYIDEAISRQEQLIEKLGEYRKSVIHHAVTGKIDCTEA